ncbi:MAG: hypothetical protein H0W72_17725 [Planctomycetes bacterium]|nr:hypothetical protein [Planctomycetota bacterium]
MLLLLLFGPGLLALGALFGIVLFAGRLGEATPRQRAGLWVLIVGLGLVAFGIAGCYAWVFTGNLRIGG